jgi:endonuclease III
MKRAAKAARIQAILDDRIGRPPIPLAHSDPFTLLCAVLLSAQCTDERVNLVTPALFAQAPNAAALAAMAVADVQQLIRSLGLAPQKAKALVGLGQQLMARFGGEVPRDLDALETLPGVGHKTASVVLAQAFGQPAFPVDTHIHRLARRWGLSNGSSVERTERDLKRVFPTARWNDLHLQIIWFGRRFCPAVKHVVDACPICCWAMSKATQAAERRSRRRSAPVSLENL